ncbi:MAG: monovalent cation/H+ antiporter subunit D family protein [Candidatus Syntrophonatronum acetioxidans]|uniref:Monovalent cation/H+ antiporter subunit D family protein n=1 Tax=Candidatus Syntrophonatronum acetioxidans TaxID=1795816 RepID=A0A424YF49_9FIRM|nr:MAG: monovalent cation/H+ antiporter subunit D family protein [Candidatus Syntrophonatronum acetioxidans]
MWFLPLLAILIPGVGAALIYSIQEERFWLRGTIALGTVLINFLLVLRMFYFAGAGDFMEMVFFNLAGADFLLRVDYLSLVFALLCGFLWIFSIGYSIGYMEDHPNNRRFFTFYVLNLGVACGIAFAGNLFTLFIFYKLLTLSTFPLVAHSETEMARRATRIYIYYSVASGALLLYTVVVLQSLYNLGRVDTLTFTPAGFLSTLPVGEGLLIAFVIGFLGFAVKAALIPLHHWLPQAMVALAPVSALFHAVAVVNTGVFGIMRLVYYVYGPQWITVAQIQMYLVALAIITIIAGSLRALMEEELKLRLAYSTVSQMGYLALGTVLLLPTAFTGALLHFFNHAFLKITLFFCAGIIIGVTGKTKISELSGVGRKYSRTMGAFSIAALGLIGLPPISGYLIKLYLIRAGLQLDTIFETILIISVVFISALLNAFYYLPIIIQAFWGKEEFQEGEPFKKEKPLLVVPALILALACVALGIFPFYLTLPLAELVVESIWQGLLTVR